MVDSSGDRARAGGKARTIRLPVHTVEKLNRINRAQRALVVELGREPTHEETAELVGLDRDQVESIKRMSQQPLSLEKLVGDEDGAVLGQLLADEHAESPYARAVDILNMEALSQALGCLSDRARRMLELRYGLGDACPCTLARPSPSSASAHSPAWSTRSNVAHPVRSIRVVT